MTDKTGFDPSKYLSKVSGKEYLEVKWRLVWLRDVAPDAELTTEHIRIDDQAAIFKATVILPSGGKATGYGNVNAGEFPDYIGKAETVAIGRALAALGFGTQFAGDFAEEGRSLDGPLKERASSNPKVSPTPIREPAPGPRTDGERTVSTGQLRYIEQEAKAAGYDAEEIEAEVQRRFSVELAALNKDQYRDLIEWLKAEQKKQAG